MFTTRDVSQVVRATGLGAATVMPALKEHLMTLSEEDKYKRFYIPTTEASIDKYLRGIDLSGPRDAIFVVYNGTGDKVIGMCHVAITETGEQASAELALSVSPSHRNRKIGIDMLERAVLHCKSLGIRRVYMFCLATNVPMQRMARKLGMRVVTEFDESTGTVELPTGHAPAVMLEVLAADSIAFYDLSCRQAVNAVSCLVASMITPTTGTIIPIKDE